MLREGTRRVCLGLKRLACTQPRHPVREILVAPVAGQLHVGQLNKFSCQDSNITPRVADIDRFSGHQADYPPGFPLVHPHCM